MEDVVERLLGSGVDDGNVGPCGNVGACLLLRPGFLALPVAGGRVPLGGDNVQAVSSAPVAVKRKHLAKKGRAVGNRALICARRGAERALLRAELVTVMEYN